MSIKDYNGFRDSGTGGQEGGGTNADQLTLSHPGRADYADHSTTFQNCRHPCELRKLNIKGEAVLSSKLQKEILSNLFIFFDLRFMVIQIPSGLIRIFVGLKARKS